MLRASSNSFGRVLADAKVDERPDECDVVVQPSDEEFFLPLGQLVAHVPQTGTPAERGQRDRVTCLRSRTDRASAGGTAVNGT